MQIFPAGYAERYGESKEIEMHRIKIVILILFVTVSISYGLSDWKTPLRSGDYDTAKKLFWEKIDSYGSLERATVPWMAFLRHSSEFMGLAGEG